MLAAGGVAVLVSRSSGGSSASSGAGAPHYVDETGTAGIDHVYAGGFEFFVGGGVAAFDCDDDGRDELYFAGGSEPAALYRNESPAGGALRFTQQASPVTDLTDVTGAYPIDIDSDDHVDLVVLRRRGNHVLRGLGDCEFEDATAALGVEPGDDWTVAFSATWEGSNTLPTLAFGSYLVPDGDTCGDSRLVRPAAYLAAQLQRLRRALGGVGDRLLRVQLRRRERIEPPGDTPPVGQTVIKTTCANVT